MLFKLLSVLGALAWLPSLINFIRNIFLKPKLIINSHEELEIGYTTFGPILNLQLSFLAENKKLLIKKINVQLTHQNKDMQVFNWIWFEEILLEMNMPGGGSVPYRKNQNAVVINIAEDMLIEKKIGFQQNTFRVEYKNLLNALNEDYANIIGSSGDINNLKTFKNYNNLLNLFNNSFNWKIGKYSVVLQAYIPDRKEPFEHKFDFSLNNLEIQALKTNIEICKKLVEKKYVNNTLEVKDSWIWINPYKLTEDQIK